MSSNVDLNIRPDFDNLISEIANYVSSFEIESDLALDTARNCLMDTIGCGLLALQFPACTKMLGPIVKDSKVPFGVRVPGTDYELDPVKGAFDIGCIVRWLDYNDTWLAAEWGHPSDNLGAILSVCDFISQQNIASGKASLKMRTVLESMIMAHEIQGVLALENSFNKAGLDHVVLVKVASTAIATKLMGGSIDQIKDAVSHAWVDGQSLRTYRHAPNAGTRKSWAAGDATSRAVRLAMITMSGEMGYPSVLSTPVWGFEDVLFDGKQIVLPQPLGTYVMENVLFKISFPAEFHAQTAVEASVKLHNVVKDRINEISRYQWQPNGEMKNFLSEDEVYNLSIARGTLTAEERKVINDHIVVTIKMLEELPYPKHLKNVPEFAGGHHEKLDGTGYPKGLTKDEMSVQARIMAIADIFEALTARDRPYKKGKTLSQAMRILGFMKDDAHIDVDLFDIFVKEKIYLKYADGFLEPEQIDEVKI